jgi:integrase/recombinase XerD
MIKAVDQIELNKSENGINQDILDRKIDFATAGVHSYLHRDLTENVSPKNALTIAEYILEMKTENNLSDNYRVTTIELLSILSKFHKNKAFLLITRDDIISYLDSLRKPDMSDPLHKWIGTYNLRRTMLLRFFKWLYYPDDTLRARKIPAVVQKIPMLKRKEQSIYKPTDLWTVEDDLLFLKYCPNKRDRCYHAVSRDTSCRPHEILNLRIKDVVFKTAENHQYAEVLVNGKTGSRVIPLFNSLPFVKDWLDEHFQRGNPSAFLIPSRDRKNFGKKLRCNSVNCIYRYYKSKYFPKLLKDPHVPRDEKQKITNLLDKPWNPYIRRHSALTKKSTILKEHTLRQHAGWSGRSQMHLKYLHYFGNESSENLLEAYGIIHKDKRASDALKPKQCPNCGEPNKPDNRFCAKCRMVLTYDAYSETQQEKESEVQKLQEKYEQDMKIMREEMNQQFNQILSLIQKNPQLAQVKPEVLANKKMQ